MASRDEKVEVTNCRRVLAEITRRKRKTTKSRGDFKEGKNSEQATSCGYKWRAPALILSCLASLMALASGLERQEPSALVAASDSTGQVTAALLQSMPMLMMAAPASSASSLRHQQQQQQQQPAGAKQVEILVQPNSPVRIECRLPPLVAASNKSRTFYWNFQRTSIQDQKPDLLAYGTDYINAQSYGIELDFDQTSGTYDLVIQNATYELNDGIYYCDYRDTAPDSRATINREFRLTVLSK